MGMSTSSLGHYSLVQELWCLHLCPSPLFLGCLFFGWAICQELALIFSPHILWGLPCLFWQLGGFFTLQALGTWLWTCRLLLYDLDICQVKLLGTCSWLGFPDCAWLIVLFDTFAEIHFYSSASCGAVFFGYAAQCSIFGHPSFVSVLGVALAHVCCAVPALVSFGSCMACLPQGAISGFLRVLGCDSCCI